MSRHTAQRVLKKAETVLNLAQNGLEALWQRFQTDPQALTDDELERLLSANGCDVAGLNAWAATATDEELEETIHAREEVLRCKR